MNRRKFLKGIGLVLAGLSGGLVVAEELEKFAEQKELEWQFAKKDHCPDCNIHIGHRCKCELVDRTEDLDWDLRIDNGRVTRIEAVLKSCSSNGWIADFENGLEPTEKVKEKLLSFDCGFEPKVIKQC